MTEQTPLSQLEQWKLVPIDSEADLIAIMHSDRYRDQRDQAYRDAVAAKLLISPALRHIGISETTGPVSSHDPSVGRASLVVGSGALEEAQRQHDDTLRREAAEQAITAAEEQVAATKEFLAIQEAQNAIRIPNAVPRSDAPKPYASREAQQAAMRDSRYKNDPAYRQEVEARIAVTDF